MRTEASILKGFSTFGDNNTKKNTPPKKTHRYITLLLTIQQTNKQTNNKMTRNTKWMLLSSLALWHGVAVATDEESNNDDRYEFLVYPVADSYFYRDGTEHDVGHKEFMCVHYDLPSVYGLVAFRFNLTDALEAMNVADFLDQDSATSPTIPEINLCLTPLPQDEDHTFASCLIYPPPPDVLSIETMTTDEFGYQAPENCLGGNEYRHDVPPTTTGPVCDDVTSIFYVIAEETTGSTPLQQRSTNEVVDILFMIYNNVEPWIGGMFFTREAPIEKRPHLIFTSRVSPRPTEDPNAEPPIYPPASGCTTTTTTTTSLSGIKTLFSLFLAAEAWFFFF
jgi:hypothetical protein